MLKRLLLTTLIALITSVVYADPSPYQVTVPVASQAQSDWQTGVTTAFTQMLTQLTGDDKILSNKKIKKQLSQATSYVQSFTYINTPQPNGQSQTQLQVQFYQQAISDLLQDAGGVVVAAPAPAKTTTQTLIWLAVQTPKGKTLLNSNSKDDFSTTLQNSAQQDNLTILLPMMDLQDMQQVTLDNVWQLDPTNLVSAAKRYGAQNILAAKIFSDDNQQWQGQWIMITGNQITPGNIQGNDPKDVITKMMNKISNNLTSYQTAKNTSGNNTITLNITNVNGLDDYADILKYLRGLAPVKSADVASVDSTNLTVSVQAIGGETALTDAINTDNKMAAIPSSDSNPDALDYRWLNSTDANPPPTPNNNNLSAADHGIDMGS